MTKTDSDGRPEARLPVRVALVRQPWGIWRSLTAARKNLLSILPDIATRQPMVSGRTGLRWHMVMDPGAIRHMLHDHLEDYPKSRATKNLLKPAIGNSMFVAEGAHWRWQRRAAAPAFSHRNVTNLAPVMTAAADRCCARVAAANGQPQDMMDEMVKTTFDVISEVTFSGDGQFDSEAVHRAIDAYIAAAGKVSLFDMIGVPDWVPRPGRWRSRSVLRQMKDVADQSIAARQNAGPRALPDLLDLLIEGEDPDSKRRMNTSELRDNLLTFIVAGHETTALTLAWALYLCAFDQNVQSRARTEAGAVLNGRTATAEDLAQLPFIRSIIDETLRLYPPAAILSRTARKSDTLCGREVRAGDTVMIPVYALHRHHQLWQNPDAFDPDRFGDRKSIDRYAYLPFGDGPRICIGASFAVQEATIILATLLSKFQFTSVADHTPEPVMILTLRPAGGVWLQARPL